MEALAVASVTGEGWLGGTSPLKGIKPSENDRFLSAERGCSA
jgi:hypothetical protein